MNNADTVHAAHGHAHPPHQVLQSCVGVDALRPVAKPLVDVDTDRCSRDPFEHQPSCRLVDGIDGRNAQTFSSALGEYAGFGQDSVFRETLVEGRVSPGLGGSVFQSARDVWLQICGFVEAAFGALGNEGWRGRGGVFEDLGERKLVSLGCY